MTPEEKKEVIRVHGADYDENDIPAIIRKRDEALIDEAEEIESRIWANQMPEREYNDWAEDQM